jgi:exosome complex exonuclease DIS3/RRP44
MTYEQAQTIKDDAGINNEIAQSLRQLHSIAAQLREKRMNKGALVLESSEVRFDLDTETRDPLSVINKELRETNWLVEEFMLLANISVAEKIYELFPDCACLRKHPAPPISNFDPLVKAAETKV